MRPAADWSTGPGDAWASGAPGGRPGGASSGGPPAGASSGGPPAGASSGGPPAGASSGGPPAGASSGGPPAGASSGGPTAGAGAGWRRAASQRADGSLDGPAPTTDWREAAGLVAWLVGLAAAIWLLQAAGRGVLAPPTPSVDGVRRWFQERDGVTVGFAVLRLLAVGLAWYLVVTTVVGLAVRLAGARRAVRWADTATVPGVRRLLSGVAGIGLTATSAALAAVPLPAGPLAAAPPTAEPSPPDDPSPPAVMTRLPEGTATMRRLPDHRAPATTTTTAPPSTTTTSSTTRPPSTSPTTTAPPPASPGTGPAPPTADPQQPADGRDSAASPSPPVDQRPADRPASAPAPSGGEGGETWTIEAGDHLWAVAEETLADAWGRPPTDDEVLAYWTALVDANRSRLADPANPDLVFPGQVITLPPAPVPHSS